MLQMQQNADIISLFQELMESDPVKRLQVFGRHVVEAVVEAVNFQYLSDRVFVCCR